uniref:Uncharacterized protein n=1 Tax=Rhizophora mucronata TaxID=61149 RepID=A0A2P2PNA5_RHIMU
MVEVLLYTSIVCCSTTFRNTHHTKRCCECSIKVLCVMVLRARETKQLLVP